MTETATSTAPRAASRSAPRAAETPAPRAPPAVSTPAPKSAKTPSSARSTLQPRSANVSGSTHVTPRADRFIPNRSAMNMDAVQCSTSPSRDSPSPTPSEEKRAASASSSATKPEDEAKVVYKKRLASALLGEEDGARHKILKFTAKPAVPPPESFQSSLHARFSHNKLSSIPSANARKLNRHVPSAPKKVLDAPELMNDYYLNLLSWGQNNILAVALGQSVYLWNEQTGKIDELMVLDGSTYVSSVNWSDANGSSYLAVGTSDSVVQLWDVAAFKQVRSMNGHSSRVGALSWNNYIVSSGSRDSTIVHHDVRARAHNIATLAGHRQEVCGLSWSPDGTTLASGGNDNKLCLWKASSTIGSSARTHSPTFCLEQHSAAVKAIAWCPWERNLLATGGGTADRTIKFWNTSNGALLNSVDTGSQVCSLLWSHSEKELLSSHGYSQNELCLWKYPSMTKVKELTGHTSRVLHLAASPDGSTVVSGAADETLRFWEVFGPNRKAGKAGSAATELTTSSLSNVMSIR